jgi:hypothetical protein
VVGPVRVQEKTSAREHLFRSAVHSCCEVEPIFDRNLAVNTTDLDTADLASVSPLADVVGIGLA